MSKSNTRERIRLGDIRYLALEGGGGKGACYLGALRLLSDPSLLPATATPLLPLSSDSPLKGLSGASAGSIVTYMLAIGMTVEEINTEMLSKVTYDPAAPEPIKPGGSTPVFNTFFEPPQPGVRKGVYYDAGRNVSGYAVDQLKAARSKEIADGADLVKKIFPLVISETKSARFFRAYREALRAGRTNQQLLTVAYPFIKLLLVEASKLVKDRKLRLLDDEGIEGLIKQRKLWPDLAASLLFDRGVLSGNAVREYVRYLTHKYLKPSRFAGRSLAPGFTDASIAKLDPSTLTFRDLYQITGCKLVLMGTNITNKLSLPFSAEATPDFPLVDAVGLSMSIPGLFKPTFVAGEVKLDRDPDTAAHNYRYKGFFVDGGMLVNIPMHAFDREADNPNPGMLHERILGLGLADGVDRNENPGFQSDPAYQKYRTAAQDKLTRRGQTAAERQVALKEQQKSDAAINTYLKLPDRQRNALPNMSATKDRRSFSLTPGGYSYTIHPAGRLFAPLAVLTDLLASLLGTLTDYAPEAGQFRTPAERQRYVPLDAYDITITTFTPDENLNRFVNVRSFNKLHWYFFGMAPTHALLKQHFGDYALPPAGLPRYDGAKSPTND
jgi:predicted acylesterase/phospholipase RssA